MNNNMDPDRCLKEVEKFHGHVCAGIMMGTRMAILGMKAIGIDDPMGKDRKDLLVYVETDRCATDAILVVTGCQPGKRSMKILDYGKMAATFVNLRTGKAVRVAERNTDGDTIFTREMIQSSPRTTDFAKRSDDEMFTVTEVRVDVRPEDMPGTPMRSVVCSQCGERVLDMRDVTLDGRHLCRPCAQGNTYYTPADK